MSFVEAFHKFWNHALFVSVTITHWQEAITYSINVLMHQLSSPGKFILHHWTCQILIQITSGYPRAPSHYLNRYWQINNEVMWHLTGIIFYIFHTHSLMLVLLAAYLSGLMDKQCIYSMTFFYNFHTVTHASPARCISARPHEQAMYLQHDFILRLSHSHSYQSCLLHICPASWTSNAFTAWLSSTSFTHSHSCQSCSLHICPASWTSNVFTAWLSSTTFTQSLMPVLLAAYLSSLMDKQCIYSMTLFYIFHTQSLMLVLLATYTRRVV